MTHYKFFILIILAALGFTLQLSGIIDLERLITLARQYADHWWLGVIIVAVQTLLFTFAMPGSMMVWITAVLFMPHTSTVMIVTGTTFGSIAAYLFSEHLTAEWTRTITNTRIYHFLQQQGNFISLLALRIMPGFPHSVINYSSGILKLKFINFIPAVLLGTAIKTYVYSLLIYNAASPDMNFDSIDISTVWPLLVLSLLLIAAMFVKRHLGMK